MTGQQLALRFPPTTLHGIAGLAYNLNNNDSHKEWRDLDTDCRAQHIRPNSRSHLMTSASNLLAPGRPVASGLGLSLADLAPHQVTTISALVEAQGNSDNSGVLQRLAELGFMVGETVSVLRRGPGGREPIAVQIGDTVFALRRHEASCIHVRPPA